MKVFMKDKWSLLGFVSDINMYIFANKDVYMRFGELEISCVGSAKYVDSANNNVDYLVPSKVNVRSCKTYDTIASLVSATR